MQELFLSVTDLSLWLCKLNLLMRTAWKIEWPAHPALACTMSLSDLIYYLITEIILRPIVWETDFSCFTYVFYQMHLNTFENQFAHFFVDFSVGWSGEFRREILGGNVKKEYNNLNKEMLIPGEAFKNFN